MGSRKQRNLVLKISKIAINENHEVGSTEYNSNRTVYVLSKVHYFPLTKPLNPQKKVLNMYSKSYIYSLAAAKQNEIEIQNMRNETNHLALPLAQLHLPLPLPLREIRKAY